MPRLPAHCDRTKHAAAPIACLDTWNDATLCMSKIPGREWECQRQRQRGSSPLGVQPVTHRKALLVAGSWATPGLGVEEGAPCGRVNWVVCRIQCSPAPGLSFVLCCMQPASAWQRPFSIVCKSYRSSMDGIRHLAYTQFCNPVLLML